MNRKELLENVLSTHPEFSNWTYKQAEEFLGHMIDSIKNAVKRGEEVSLIGLGTFTKVHKAARRGTNPLTGAQIAIKERTIPKFKPGQAFKDYL